MRQSWLRFLAAISIFLLGAASSPAPAGDDYKTRFDAAIALHDKGDYEGAVAAFERLLDVRPDDSTLRCELANSCLAAGKLEEAVVQAERGLKLSEKTPAFCANVLGSALDDKGEAKKAGKVFRKAIKKSPGYALLHFNLGINLIRQNRSRDAIEEFQEAIRLDPGHPGSWRALALSWQDAGLRARAFAAFARFLTLEPTGERAAYAAKQLDVLLYQGVEDKGDDSEGERQLNVTLNSRPAMGDKASGPLEAGMAIVAVGRWTQDWKDKSDAAFFAYAFDKILAIFGDLAGGEAKESPFWREQVLAYFDEARAAGHIEAMAWDLRRSLREKETAAWLEAHADDVGGYRAWSSAWKPSRS